VTSTTRRYVGPVQRLAILAKDEPDWEAGASAAYRFVPDYNDPNWDHLGEGTNALFKIRRQLHHDVMLIRHCWLDAEYRPDTVGETHVGPYYVLIVQPATWGQIPGPAYEAVCRLWTSDVALALGFE
jgi:hypothetical protein